jgi:hypothetical protein
MKMMTTYELDDEGFVEFGDLEDKFFYLEEMRKQRAALDAAIDRAEVFFKAAMKQAGATGFKINGVKKVSYKQDATFPVAKYVAANPHVAAVYTKMTPSFDIEAFKRDRHEEWLHWRGHSFKFIQPKNGNR